MMCKDNIEEYISAQKEINARYGTKIDNLTAQVLHLQDVSISMRKFNDDLANEFKSEREETRKAIAGLAQALKDTDDNQKDRHEKSLDVQQQNLEANLQMLAIFQAHKVENNQEFERLEGKVVVSSWFHKALAGLGITTVSLLFFFVTSAIYPEMDVAIHAAFATIVDAIKGLLVL